MVKHLRSEQLRRTQTPLPNRPSCPKCQGAMHIWKMATEQVAVYICDVSACPGQFVKHIGVHLHPEIPIIVRAIEAQEASEATSTLAPIGGVCGPVAHDDETSDVPELGEHVLRCDICQRLYPKQSYCPNCKISVTDAEDDTTQSVEVVYEPKWKSQKFQKLSEFNERLAMQEAPVDYGLDLLAGTEAWSHLMDIRREKVH